MPTSKKIYSVITEIRFLLFGLNRLEVISLFSIITLGVILRVYFLSQPMRFDESATFLHYVNNHWLSLFNYTAPNNHLLNTVLIKLVTSIWGGHPEIIRLPAFLFSISSIVLTFIVCRCLGSPGWFAAALVACHPYLILFATNARGYSALVFFTLLFLLQGIFFLKNRDYWSPRILGLIGAIGLFNLPIMLFSIFGITLWMSVLLYKTQPQISLIIKSFYSPLFLYGITTCLILYGSVLFVTSFFNNGIGPAFQLIFNNEFVTSGESSFFFSTLRSYAWNLLRVYTQEISLYFIFITLAFVLMAILRDTALKNFRTTSLLLIISISTILIFFIKHTFPYPRTWIFMIPIVAVVADQGFGYLLSLFRNHSKLIYYTFLLCVISVVPTLLNPTRMSLYADTGTFTDAPAIAKNIHHFLNNEDLLVANVIPSSLPIYYYLWHERTFNPKLQQNNTPVKTYIFLPNDKLKLEMYSHPPHPIDTSLPKQKIERVEQIFNFNGSILYRLKN